MEIVCLLKIVCSLPYKMHLTTIVSGLIHEFPSLTCHPPEFKNILVLQQMKYKHIK